MFDKIKDSGEKSVKSTKSAVSEHSADKSKKDSKGSASPVPSKKPIRR